ncbi:DUF2927 domain-containing protein [Roseospirillum parvum]|uniref:Uncharacterized protein n=1 Tax=Roseospirillum parvum TaxID=83401 RepID=A0A1G8CJJ9_9PROT|nr:DUF2927 domain-containing protein [Roseospirillum parvum]SDH45648.1 Protein of unknown function [Roseospirillum parvum]
MSDAPVPPDGQPGKGARHPALVIIRVIVFSIVLLVVAMGIGLVVSDPEARKRPTVDRVSELFDKLAFSGFGVDGPDGDGPILRRWEEPVRIVVMGPRHAVMRGQVESLVQALDALDSLDVAVSTSLPFDPDPEARAEALAGGNLSVISVPAGELEAFIAAQGYGGDTARQLASARYPCLVLGAEAGLLTSATVFVRDGLNDGRMNRCLLHKVSFALGLNVDDDTFFEAFQPLPEGGVELSPVGRLAVGMVYGPTFSPGMAREPALEQARRLLERLDIPDSDRPGDRPVLAPPATPPTTPPADPVIAPPAAPPATPPAEPTADGA